LKKSVYYRLLPTLLSAVLAAAATMGCAGKLRGGGGGDAPTVFDEAAIESILRGGPTLTAFKGYGDVSMSSGGALTSGKIEARRRNNGYVKANIYSPFGTIAASISAEDFKGSLKIDKEVKEFTYDDKMEDAPFPCAKNFTYGQFINIMTGALPDVFRELPASPDSLKRSKKAPDKTTAVWNFDTLSVRMRCGGKKGKPPRLEAVTFGYNIGGSKFWVQFANFKRGIASEITVKEGNKNYIIAKNYIIVRYESVVAE